MPFSAARKIGRRETFGEVNRARRRGRRRTRSHFWRYGDMWAPTQKRPPCVWADSIVSCISLRLRNARTYPVRALLNNSRRFTKKLLPAGLRRKIVFAFEIGPPQLPHLTFPSSTRPGGRPLFRSNRRLRPGARLQPSAPRWMALPTWQFRR